MHTREPRRRRRVRGVYTHRDEPVPVHPERWWCARLSSRRTATMTTSCVPRVYVYNDRRPGAYGVIGAAGTRYYYLLTNDRYMCDTLFFSRVTFINSFFDGPRGFTPHPSRHTPHDVPPGVCTTDIYYTLYRVRREARHLFDTSIVLSAYGREGWS